MSAVERKTCWFPWSCTCSSLGRSSGKALESRRRSEAQWRPCFFPKILLKAFFLRPPDDSLSSPPSSSRGLLLAQWCAPVPRLLPDELERDEKVVGLSLAWEVANSELVEQEEAREAEELPLNSTRLELFSRPPPPPPPTQEL